MNIYLTPDRYFVTNVRDIFQKTRLKHTDETEYKAWLNGPNIGRSSSTSQFFCATQVLEYLAKPSTAECFCRQIRAFYKLYFYFTVRRVLFQLDGIQSKTALPGDLTFN